MVSHSLVKLIVLRQDEASVGDAGLGLLRFSISSEPIASLVLDGLSRGLCLGRNGHVIFAVPEGWNVVPSAVENVSRTLRRRHLTGQIHVMPHTVDMPVPFEPARIIMPNAWCVLSDGRFATEVNSKILKNVLDSVQADVVAIDVEPELRAYREKVLSTTQGRLAGCRRVYTDSVEPTPFPNDWPHHLLVKRNLVERVLANGAVPCSFADFLSVCRLNGLSLRGLKIPGAVWDLGTEEGLLGFCGAALDDYLALDGFAGKVGYSCSSKPSCNGERVAADAKFVGPVLLGSNVSIGSNAVVAGPSILGDNVDVGKGTVVRSSIIGPGVSIPRNQFVQCCIVKGPRIDWESIARSTDKNLRRIIRTTLELGSKQRTVASWNGFETRAARSSDVFRKWPRFSYTGCFKRFLDLVVAAGVLILFVPVTLFIAMAIKLSSSGPVFFKDKRQGRYGRTFHCLKFRTMIVGADDIQEKLRVVNEADGPQFKISDDPRLTTVGRFLRDTYLDEVPQFFNVLLGHMSVVGPRPSPDSENTLCAAWRDARLSVRPGITGLWQVCRTRQPMKDFQEWIHYDTKYVRDLTLRMDLWICWQTVKKMVRNFIRQF